MTMLCFTCRSRPAGNKIGGPNSAYCGGCQPRPVHTGLKPRGTQACQCPLCFEVFSGESTFVWHRIDQASRPSRPGEYFLGECRDPAIKGMVLSDTGIWGSPAPATAALRPALSGVGADDRPEADQLDSDTPEAA